MSIISNLEFSLNATMPLFFMMVLGYILRQIGFIDENTTKNITRLVFRIFLPALLFMDLVNQDFLSIWDTKMVLFCFLSTIISIGLAILLSLMHKEKRERGEIIQAAYRSGAATLGIAFMSNIYDETSSIALMILGSVPLYNVAAVIILSITSPENDNSVSSSTLFQKTVLDVIKNPIILGIILGMSWSLLHLPLPIVAQKTLTYMGNLASPLALIGLGSAFEFIDMKRKWKPTTLVSIAKLFLFCIIFIPIAISLGFTDQKLVAILTMLGSATTSSCYIMAKNMGHDGIISSCAVMITTLLSSFSLTFWLFLLKTLGYI